jgi:DNA polymerase-3 subunit beta
MLKDAANHAMIPTKTTLKVLERVAIYADERSHAVRFTVKDGALTIYASSVETGDAQGVVPIRDGQYGDLEYGLNANYVAEFLRETDAQHVAFCWQADDIAPALSTGKQIKSNQKSCEFCTADGWRYCVMPMRLN